ncbi:maleylpyruvate isomerase N-terminal domain-containing protein [Nocardioides sp.]|uniref:maleylpyruvate isomerase N-terminal domain-containing protein n=1 Tax=Nocardioides sp. TaxID=35761 RepID=UPI0035276BF7
MTAASAAPAAPAERPLELVERSLAYARGVLVAVPGHPADLATPCADWDLGDLLAHMVDGFTAFVQAAAGVVSPEPPAGLPREPALLAGHLLDLGCGVLGEWASPAGRARVLCGLPLPTEVVLEVAALEIAVHGWDVAQVCSPRRRLPAQLAAALLPAAVRRVGAADRPHRFGAVRPGSRRDPEALLLAHCGRAAPRGGALV